MTDLEKNLAELGAEYERKVQTVTEACPVTPEWLGEQFCQEATGQTYERWLESKVILLARLSYQHCGEEGLSPQDAHAGLEMAFQAWTSS